MKSWHLISMLAAVLLLAGCGVLSRTPEEKAAEEARTMQLVRQRLAARKYRVDIGFMKPLRGGMQSVTSPYSLTVNGSHLISYLPYIGVAYNLPYGGGKGLNFESEISEYTERWLGDRHIIVFVTKNDEDVLVYHLEVFDNGSADLNVRSRNRESIDFRGELNPDFDPDAPEE